MLLQLLHFLHIRVVIVQPGLTRCECKGYYSRMHTCIVWSIRCGLSRWRSICGESIWRKLTRMSELVESSVGTCTRKTGHESVFEPVNETVTGGTSRNDSCPGNWSQLQQRWSIRYLSIDLSQECCLIERAWSCVLGGRVECESVSEPNNKTETGGTSRNDSCHDNWSHLR